VPCKGVFFRPPSISSLPALHHPALLRLTAHPAGSLYFTPPANHRLSGVWTSPEAARALVRGSRRPGGFPPDLMRASSNSRLALLLPRKSCCVLAFLPS